MAFNSVKPTANGDVKDYVSDLDERTKTEFNLHSNSRTSEVFVSIINLATATQTVVNTGVDKKIKSINCTTIVPNTTKMSDGFCDENNMQYTRYRINGGSTDGAFTILENSMIMISETSTTNRIHGKVTLSDKKQFVINWTKIGTGATGNLNCIFLINYHD